MKRMVEIGSQTYQIFSNLSLDVATGVFLQLAPVAMAFNLHPGPGWYLGVPLATWFIYLFDHFMDIRMNPRIRTERHNFIQKHAFHVKLLMGCTALCCLIVLYRFYDDLLFYSGFMTGVLCLSYFLLNSIRNPWFRLFYNKELWVSITYSTGIYSLVGISLGFEMSWFIFYVIHMLLTYQSILGISISEFGSDRDQEQFSWIQIIGQINAIRLNIVVAGMALLLLAGTLLYVIIPSPMLTYIYLTVWFAQVLLFHILKNRISLEMLRKISELIYWIPGLFYLMGMVRMR